jgi:hypothetical protein
MQRYFDVVQTTAGNAIPGALVYVYVGSTTVLATLFADNGVTAAPNPLTTNTDGEYAFYAANGTYTLQIAATGYAGETKPGVVLFDPSNNVSFGSVGNSVGINETNPATTFWVASSDDFVATFRNTDSSAAYIDFYNDNGTGTNDVYCGSESSTFVIYAGSAKRLVIDDIGNLKMITGPVMPYAPAPASISVGSTLTNQDIQAQIINTTGTSFTLTMPTGTTLENSAFWFVNNIGYDFYIINTASGTITIAANTGVTTLGGLTIATGTSAQFRIRRTAASTFVLYRLG